MTRDRQRRIETETERDHAMTTSRRCICLPLECKLVRYTVVTLYF